LIEHDVRTVVELQWPLQLENGELLKAAKASGFDALVTADQNIHYQQNLSKRKLAMVVLGSNIWPIVRSHRTEIEAGVRAAKPGSYDFIEMPIPKSSYRGSSFFLTKSAAICRTASFSETSLSCATLGGFQRVTALALPRVQDCYADIGEISYVAG